MPQNIKGIKIYTLGCRVNQYESAAIEARLIGAGFSCGGEGDCAVCVVNTCAVTAESERKSRQLVRRAVSRNPGAFVIVTGCCSQLNREGISAIGGVGFVCGNCIPDGVVCDDPGGGTGDCTNDKIRTVVEAAIGGITSRGIGLTACGHAPAARRVRDYIKIQDGCGGLCSYCVIPSVRGKPRSRRPGDIIAEAAEMVKSGCREIILTGIEVASYAGGLPRLAAKLGESGITRIRLGSLDPAAVSEDFAAKLAESRCIMPHFHLSAQSGSDAVLRRMKRPYDRARLDESARLLRGYFPGAMLTADIIVGFPGESEGEFAETREYIERTRFLGAHIFPYSKRPGTPAAKLSGQILQRIKADRAAELRGLQSRIRRGLLDGFQGDVIDGVLFEEVADGYAVGHAPNFVEVRVKQQSGAPPAGEIGSVRISGADYDGCEYCYGEVENGCK